jgi:glycine/D-amino acid oxidase-like deaminating enzyme
VDSGQGQRGVAVNRGVFWQGGDARWDASRSITPLTRTIRADVCIVGGGFTGLWSALSLKKLAGELDVVLLEQTYCGHAASGRNGGWLNAWDDILPTLTRLFGQSDALALLDLSHRSLRDITQVVGDGAIDCDLAMEGGLIVATSEAQQRGVLETVAGMEAAGRGSLVRALSAEEASQMSGIPEASGGYLLEHAGSVQPALLAQGLRRLALAAGVQVFESSPMVKLHREAPAVVDTLAGSVIADQVILACGSWLARVSELRRTLFIIPTHVVATEPCEEDLDALGWTRGRPFADARTAVHYGQRTADHRMVFGRGGGRLGFAGHIIPEHFHDPRETREIAADMRRMMPAMKAARIDWAWGGPIDRTQHGMPWVGGIGRHGNIHYGVGYCGNGVVPSHVIGSTLASVTLGLDDDYSRSPLVSDPPSYLPAEPLRSVGARLVRDAVIRCEEREDAGRTADPVSRVLRRALSLSMPKGIQVAPLAERVAQMTSFARGGDSGRAQGAADYGQAVDSATHSEGTDT